MHYKSVLESVHISRSTEQPAVIAEREYRRRLDDWSAYRTGIVLRGHEAFVVAYAGLTGKMDRIRDREGKIAGLWNGLPPLARRAYLFDLIGAELESTNDIEGVRSTRREISDALEAAGQEDAPHRRFGEFARLFLTLADDDPERYALPRTLQDIRGIYDRVVAGEVKGEQLPDGDLFRKEAVYIDDMATGRRIHTGITPEADIKVALTQWLAFIGDRDIPPLIRACAGHCAFEYIHPFYDGNGRTGRFLFALQLRQQVSIPTAISVSTVISDGKNAYYKALEDAQNPLNCQDLSKATDRMLGFIGDAQERLVTDLTMKTKVLARTAVRLQAVKDTHRLDEHEANVLGALAQEELFGRTARPVTRHRLMEGLGIGYRRTVSATSRLNELGLVERTGAHPIRYRLTDQARSLLHLA